MKKMEGYQKDLEVKAAALQALQSALKEEVDNVSDDDVKDGMVNYAKRELDNIISPVKEERKKVKVETDTAGAAAFPPVEDYYPKVGRN